MPIGILRQAEFGTINGHLKDGDAVIMMSDGATENSLSKIKAFVAENNVDEDLPQKLCVIAKSREISKADDITVVAIKIKAHK
jgi:serine phosphatase RsbU (regulator of sigma subunit)